MDRRRVRGLEYRYYTVRAVGDDEAHYGYRKVAAELRAAINRGEYAPEETLPRQVDIAAHYGVNVGTVRRAVHTLASEGLVTPVQGRGTVVRARPPIRRLGVERYAKRRWTSGVVAFGVDREASGREWKPTDQTQTVREVPAREAVAELFDIAEGAPVVERARVVREEGTPTHTLTSYYLPEHVRGTALVDDAPGPAGGGGGFAVLEAEGLEPDHISETVSARMPTRAEALLFELPEGVPVMVLERHTYTADDRLVEVAVGVHPASRFAWTYNFPIPD